MGETRAEAMATAIDPRLARVAHPRVLELILLPTEHCNFRCTYCYEDFKIGRMAPDIVTGVKRWIDSRAGDLSLLSLSWFGGEPTLALPIVLEVTRHGRDALLRSAMPKARFQASMTTNAYRLTPDVFAELAEAGVTTYQITLDGPRAIHDRRRLRADGKGTFDVIWGNLAGISGRAHELPPDVRIELRLHYDGVSADALEPLVESICSELLPSGLFNIRFHEIERLGGANDRDIAIPTQSDHQRIRELSEKLAGAAGQPASEVAADMNGYVCYAAKANAFVVRADGRIGKCTVALNDPRNDVGRLNADGRIDWHPGRIDPWLRGITTMEPHVLACPLDGMESFLQRELRQLSIDAASVG